MSEAMTMTAIASPAPGLWATLKEDLACVFQRDPAARSTLEVLTTYPGVHAILAHRLSHRLWLAGWRFMARFLPAGCPPPPSPPHGGEGRFFGASVGSSTAERRIAFRPRLASIPATLSKRSGFLGT